MSTHATTVRRVSHVPDAGLGRIQRRVPSSLRVGRTRPGAAGAMEDTVRASAREVWSSEGNWQVPIGAMKSSGSENCVLAAQQTGDVRARHGRGEGARGPDDAMAVDDGMREHRSEAARLSTSVRLTGAAHLTHHRVVDGTRLNTRWRTDLRR